MPLISPLMPVPVVCKFSALVISKHEHTCHWLFLSVFHLVITASAISRPASTLCYQVKKLLFFLNGKTAISCVQPSTLS